MILLNAKKKTLFHRFLDFFLKVKTGLNDAMNGLGDEIKEYVPKSDGESANAEN